MQYVSGVRTDFGSRYEWRSLPHIPDALIATITSPGPGVGSGKSRSSNSRSPTNTTPRIPPPTAFRVAPDISAVPVTSSGQRGSAAEVTSRVSLTRPARYTGYEERLGARNSGQTSE